MANWLLWNVLYPLTPILLVRIGLSAIPDEQEKGFADIIRDGQLCLYSAALGSVAIHDLWGKSIPNVSTAIFGVLFCVTLSTFMYGLAVINQNESSRRLAIISSSCALATTILVATLRWHACMY